MRNPDGTWRSPGPDPPWLNWQNHIASGWAVKLRIQEHPEWSVNLADRCVLEPTVTADLWVERDKWAGQDVLVWREKRRDGSPGAAHRCLLKSFSRKGQKAAKVTWQSGGAKSDEPFHYFGSQAVLKAAVAAAGGLVHIVEGEVDVWSLQALEFGNAVGIYGISNTPNDIASILDALGVSRFICYLDSDKAGEKGASKYGTLLHDSRWKGKQEYCKVEGPGILHKGDANDLLCHHPDLSAARAALDALPAILPHIRRRPLRRQSSDTDHDQQGWDAVYEAVRTALGVKHFKTNGYSKKNISCPNPQHDDKTPSASWHKNGYCTCHGCVETFNAKTVADWLNIDGRALTRPQLSIISANNINLDAIPQPAEAAALSFEKASYTSLRSLNKFYRPMYYRAAARKIRHDRGS